MPVTKPVTIKPHGWGNYASLGSGATSALTKEARDLTAATGDDSICRIECYGALDDLHASQIGIPAGFVTDATHYIEIVAPEAEQTTGAWDTARPTISSTAADVFGLTPGKHVQIRGLQVDLRAPSATADFGYNAFKLAATTGPIYLTLDRCLIRYSGPVTASTGPRALYFNNLPAGSVVRVTNCVFYGWPGSFVAQFGNVGTGSDIVWYNNTIHGGGTAFYFAPVTGSTGSLRVKNTIAQGQTGTAYSVSAAGWTTEYAKNLSGDASAPADTVGGGTLRSKVVQFVNAAGGDFRLAPGDTAAVDAGADLSADAAYPVTRDVRAALRTGSWDIGAHERGATIPARPGTTRTLTYDLTPAATSSLGDWVQWSITDAAFLALLQSEGDLVVRDAQNRRLPVYILSRSATALRLSVALPSPTSVATPQRVTVTVTDGGAAWVHPTSFVAPGVIPASVGPAVETKTGTGESFNAGAPSDYWVHPNTVRVSHLQSGDPGYWLRFKDAAAVTAGTPTVTHIRIDTPFPPNDGVAPSEERFENPYLLYSEDNELTWHEWNAAIDPIEPWTGGSTSYNSDPCLVLLPGGSLRTYIRQTLTGSTQYLRVHDVSGANLADAVVGAQQTATYNGSDSALAWTAPSVVKKGALYYLFYRAGGSVARVESADGLAWSNQVTALKANSTADGQEYDFKYWHGAVTGPHSTGYYYAFYSENAAGDANQGGANFRVWRSADLSVWEAAPALAFQAGSGYANNTCYQGGIQEASTDGQFHALFSGMSGSDYRVGVASISLADGQPIQALDAFRFGVAGYFTSGYATAADRGSATLGNLPGNPPGLARHPMRLSTRLGTGF